MQISGFEYAQVRLQARYGQRASESVWARLEAEKDFQSYLETARTTVLAPWVANLSANSDNHDVEHSVRGTLYTTIHEVAHWLPKNWAPAVLWLQWLVYLPALRYLLADGSVRPWMAEGHRLRPFIDGPAMARANAVVAGGGAPLVAAWRTQCSMLEAWTTAWHASWPLEGAVYADTLDALATLIAKHVSHFHEVTLEGAWSARHALSEQLRWRFRRHAMTPTPAFAYLALLALDLERLRGALVKRVLFP